MFYLWKDTDAELEMALCPVHVPSQLASVCSPAVSAFENGAGHCHHLFVGLREGWADEPAFLSGFTEAAP